MRHRAKKSDIQASLIFLAYHRGKAFDEFGNETSVALVLEPGSDTMNVKGTRIDCFYTSLRGAL